MDQLLQHGLNALMLGGTYALLGIGLTLIFGIMKVVNFTHGELYAFGAYMMYAVVMLLGANFFVALPLAIALGVALGAALELVLLRRLRGADIATRFVEEWKKRGHNVGGLTEGFRGWDGVHTIAEAIKQAGKPEPKAITQALWNVKVKGINGDIAFIKQGPAGKESAQNVPSVYVVKIENGKVVKN